ncbi:MAG: response regulator [Lachnospiraceae bacterium]|nr:response regulator [Lachnospiraceae bacterium]
MIVIGEKETFITRVLVKKVNDTGVGCVFVPWSVNEINAHLSGVSLIVLYMDIGERPPEDVLHFMIDNMEEKGFNMILVGEKDDVQYLCDHKIPEKLVYRTFSRPIDNTVFTETVTEYFSKEEMGEFKKSILIVDDDPQYLTLVREWLKNDYKVSMANSGLQAIKWLGKNKVDLILLDYEMPVTSGPQVLEMLRSDSDTATIPVMFLTGKGDKESVMAVVSLRPEGYFLKSIQKDKLLEKLKEYFVLHK